MFSKKGSLGQIRYVRRQGIIEESRAVKCKKGLIVYLKITLSPEKATFLINYGGAACGYPALKGHKSGHED